MGEYYNWVNVDKKEYICPADFDYGNKFHESMHKDSKPIHALHSLLANEWKGDHVVWFGDECAIEENSTNSVLKTLYIQSLDPGYPGDIFDMICESYRNVSCLFMEAENMVRKEIENYLEAYKKGEDFDYDNEYGIDVEKPYEGLFLKTAERRKFTINHSKRVYYSLDETEILFQNHTKCDYLDPLLILMGYGRRTEPGEWLGDVIGVSDDRPAEYSLIKELYLNW